MMEINQRRQDVFYTVTVPSQEFWKWYGIDLYIHTYIHTHTYTHIYFKSMLIFGWEKHFIRKKPILWPWRSKEGLWTALASSGSLLTFPDSSVGKEYACNAGDPSSIPRSGRSTGKGIGYPLQYSWASLVVQPVKNPPAMWETWVWSLGWGNLLKNTVSGPAQALLNLHLNKSPRQFIWHFLSLPHPLLLFYKFFVWK